MIQQLAATRLVVNETSRSNRRWMRNEMLRIDAAREIGAFDRPVSPLDYLTRRLELSYIALSVVSTTGSHHRR
jgi:hypothetical protein